MNSHPNAVFRYSLSCCICLAALVMGRSAIGAEILVEAESFAVPGGWLLDTQFIDIMGSPYMLAHGLGAPVKDTETKVNFPAAGDYRVWARTKDWVATWKVAGAPGKFQLLIDGKPNETVFGVAGEKWDWQQGANVHIDAPGEHSLALHDLTGFDGRCDAIYFTNDPQAAPPSSREQRNKLLGLPTVAPESEVYDLVVCGGGYAGMGAAISGARQGLKVALLQNRPVLGGNGSSEVQVWAQGGTRRGLYPHLGDIIEEFADHASNSPGVAEEFGDAKKEAIIRAEPNISLFLNHHVIGVATKDKQIVNVLTLDTHSGAEQRFRGKFFVDCTGHGTIGALAGASFTMLEQGHLGMSNMWKWVEVDNPPAWPETPWALALEEGDFPKTPHSAAPNEEQRKAGNVEQAPFFKGEWFWETGFNKHPINDLEYMRDWNLRAVYGAFSAMKRGKDADKHAKAQLVWMAAIGGTRESRLLQGDVVLTQEDVVAKREFPDGCVPTTWDLDLHYPKEQFMKKFPDDPFISRAVFGKGVDRKDGYPVPYRCFYSKDIGNLFMAGRCISVNHDALGTIRVMRTCGMMGEVVGKAAYLCVARGATPRGVYEQYLEHLKELMRQPGGARRQSIDSSLVLPAGAEPSAPKTMADLGPKAFARPTTGVVIDDDEAKLSGAWQEGESLGHVGPGYHYASGKQLAEARYEFNVPKSGRYEVRLAWEAHPNRATNATCTLATKDGAKTVKLDQRAKTPEGFHSIGIFEFAANQPASITISNVGADGAVHADAAQIVPAP